MKIKKRLLLITLIGCSHFLIAQPNYDKLKNEITKGWNTWSTYSMGQHVLLPHGVTINLALHKRSKNTDAFVSRFFVDKHADGFSKPIIKPGYHSYSGDYTELEISYQKVTLKVESAAYGDTLYLLVTPLQLDGDFPMAVLFEGGISWNFPGSIGRKENTLHVETPSKSFRFTTTSKPLEDPFFNTISPFLALTLDRPVGLSNATDQLGEVQAKVTAKRQAYSQYIQQFGNLSEVYAGMAASLAWNTIYDPVKDRIFSTVDREWNFNRGGYVFFGWDNFFIAQMIGLDNAKLGMANAIEALNEATEEGFVANMSQGNGRKSWDRSQPPVGSMACWHIYQKHQESWFLEEVFPKLLRWNNWWLEKRLNGKLLSWGSHLSKNPYHDKVYHNLAAAMLETGIDDSPMYEQAVFDPEKNMMQMHDVGLNAMYIADCYSLAKMAEVLGKKDDAKMLTDRGKDLQENMQVLWNKENSLYQNFDLTQNSFSERISPTSFYPLLARTASEEQAKKMVAQHLLNEEEFWGEWILPSIAKNDPRYSEQKYWKGAIWGPMNFLVYQGLKKYPDLAEPRQQFAEKSVALFQQNWLEKGFVCENYSPIDGSCTQEKLQSSPWYAWGGLLALIGLIEQGYYD
jgi:hypothetical protein